MRPLEAILDEEWRSYFYGSRPLKKAWAIARAFLVQRSRGRISRFTFVLGWVMCERYYREKRQKQQAEMLAGIKKVMDKAITDAEHLGAIYELD